GRAPPLLPAHSLRQRGGAGRATAAVAARASGARARPRARDRLMRFYRALLWLYPASFPLGDRDELCPALAQRGPRRPGPVPPMVRVVAALTDVVPNAIAVHWDILAQDLGYAVRSLRRTPGFTLTTALVVALGVGANTAVFSIADLVFVRPLPFADPGRIVQLWETDYGNSINVASPANYRDWIPL